MQIKKGKGTTEYGPGIEIRLNGDEVASAIDLYLYSKGVFVNGARTITIDGELCYEHDTKVYVDPSGFVIANGKKYDGRDGSIK